jgi:hypothetical protein
MQAASREITARPSRRWLAGVLLLLGCGCWNTSPAHVRSESFSRWQYGGQTLSLRFTVSAREASRIPRAADGMGLEKVLADYLDAHIEVQAGPSGCTRAQAPRPLASRPGYVQIEAIWHCADPPAALAVHAFFDLAAEHSHFASYESGPDLEQRLLTEENPVWKLAATDAADLPGQNIGSSFPDYVLLGFRHITSGLDHIVFLLALLLICRRRRDVIWAITGFTLGHSVTLSLAALGLVQVHVAAVEATIGLTIALVAIERAALALRSALPLAVGCGALLLLMAPFASSPGAAFGLPALAGLSLFSSCYLLAAHRLAGHGSYRILITGLFGLVHGFGFAGAFLASNAGIEVLPWTLAGFNIGVELGQLAMVAILLALGALFVRGSRLATPAADLLSASVCACGVFWFVQRALS